MQINLETCIGLFVSTELPVNVLDPNGMELTVSAFSVRIIALAACPRIRFMTDAVSALPVMPEA